MWTDQIITTQREQSLIQCTRKLLQALEAHIQDDAERNDVSPEQYCPCTADEIKEAKELLESIPTMVRFALPQHIAQPTHP